MHCHFGEQILTGPDRPDLSSVKGKKKRTIPSREGYTPTVEGKRRLQNIGFIGSTSARSIEPLTYEYVGSLLRGTEPPSRSGPSGLRSSLTCRTVLRWDRETRSSLAPRRPAARRRPWRTPPSVRPSDPRTTGPPPASAFQVGPPVPGRSTHPAAEGRVVRKVRLCLNHLEESEFLGMRCPAWPGKGHVVCATVRAEVGGPVVHSIAEGGSEPEEAGPPQTRSVRRTPICAVPPNRPQ